MRSDWGYRQAYLSVPGEVYSPETLSCPVDGLKERFERSKPIVQRVSDPGFGVAHPMFFPAGRLLARFACHGAVHGHCRNAKGVAQAPPPAPAPPPATRPGHGRGRDHGAAPGGQAEGIHRPGHVEHLPETEVTTRRIQRASDGRQYPRAGPCLAGGLRSAGLPAPRRSSRLSAAIRDRLDALVAIDGDQPHSPPAPHKGHPVEPIGWWHEATVRETGTDRGERTASADRVRRMAAHAVTSLWCASRTRRGATPLDRSLSLDDMPTQGRSATPSTGSFTVTAGSAPCCWIPTSAIPSCGPDCCWPCRRPSRSRTNSDLVHSDAERPQGALREDRRAARRTEPVHRAVSGQDEVRWVKLFFVECYLAHS